MFSPLYGWMAGRRVGGKPRNKLRKGIKVGRGSGGRGRREMDHESYLVRKIPDFIKFL